MSKNKDIATQFATELIEQLKAGTAPWQKPWEAGIPQPPFNPTTGTVYRGINRVTLGSKGFDDPRWMTLKQANEEGYRVKKGEKSSKIVFWHWSDEKKVRDKEGKPVLDTEGNQVTEKLERSRPLLQVYSVFHASQLQTQEGKDLPLFSGKELAWNPIEKAEEILNNSGVSITHDQRDRAYYAVHKDEIHLPPRENFLTEDRYYSTALHELGHSTGHPSRMNRDFGPFGSETYAKEELRAEIASWMISQELGIPHDPSQHAAYVDSWIKVLEDNPYEILSACQTAEKITEYVMGLEQQQQMESSQKTDRPVHLEIVVEINRAMADIGRWDDLGAAREANKHADASLQALAEGDERRALESMQLVVEIETESAANTGPSFAACLAKMQALGQSRSEDGLELSDVLADMAALDRGSAQQSDPTKALQEKIYLDVKFHQKDAAKAAGAKWDRDAKMWYAPEGTPVENVAAWLPSPEKTALPVLSPEEEFGQAIVKAGLILDGPPIMDGQIHRVSVTDGKPGAKDGSYCGYTDGHPNGWVRNFKTGTHEKWIATGQVLSDAEKARMEAGKAERLEDRNRELEERQSKAKKRAYAVWMNAAEVREHGYLAAKGVENFGLKQDQNGHLLVPGYDLQTGRLQTLQRIGGDSSKQFEKDCPKKGASYLIASDLKSDTGEILLAEGYATGASLHMATGKPVAVAFDADNLLAVATTLREKFPAATITICADNDHKANKNVGVEKARAAAQAVNGKVMIPTLTEKEKEQGMTDFNDIHRSRGLQAVNDHFRENTPKAEIER